MARLRRSVAMAAVLVAAASCSSGDDGSGQVLVSGGPDVGYPSGPSAWLADGSIFYPMRLLGESDSPLHLYRTRPGGGVGQEVKLGGVSSCAIPYLRDLRSLTGGGLGAVLQCPQEPNAPSTLVSIDPASGRATPLGDLHGTDAGIWSTTDGDKGWLMSDGGGCESIAPADADGIGQMPQLEPASLLPWALDGDFASPGDCTARGLISFPEPSPTMDNILVLASPEAAGVAPAARESLPWHLYELNVTDRKVRKIGGDFVQPEGLAVAGGTAVVADSTGLHAVDVQTGTTSLLSKGSFGAPAASFDGHSVVVTEYPDGDVPRIVIQPVP